MMILLAQEAQIRMKHLVKSYLGLIHHNQVRHMLRPLLSHQRQFDNMVVTQILVTYFHHHLLESGKGIIVMVMTQIRMKHLVKSYLGLNHHNQDHHLRRPFLSHQSVFDYMEVRQVKLILAYQ